MCNIRVQAPTLYVARKLVSLWCRQMGKQIVFGVAYREVPPVQLCLGKFWCFGLVLCLQEVVDYERWSHLEVPL